MMVKSQGISGYDLDLLPNHYMALGNILTLLEPLFTHLQNYYNDYNISLSYCEN